MPRLYARDTEGFERRDAALPRLTLNHMTLFRDKYRVESARLRFWDYSSPGWYFVTICTKDRKTHFGTVVVDSVNLSAIGAYVATCWQEIPAHYRGINLDDFVVMPNHIHGIVVITGPEQIAKLYRHNETERAREVSSHLKSGSLGAVVGSFKSAVSYWCWTQNLEFGWQPRFHDRIIRSKSTLKAARQYIQDNPANWHKDTLFVAEAVRRGSATSLRRRDSKVQT